jgi:hypothetical protein
VRFGRGSFSRFLWLERCTRRPDVRYFDRSVTAVEAILAARRRRLGASYEPLSFSPESYAGCRTVADHILRARKLRMERQVDVAKVTAGRPEPE